MTLNATADDVHDAKPAEIRMDDAAASSYLAEQALIRDKRESLDLAIKARWIALAVIAVLLPIINQTIGVLYYEALLFAFALTGWVQRRIGRVGQSRAELVLIFVDLLLMTLICLVPNPFNTVDWPSPMQFRFENFLYFFILLAGATLTYSWRTVIAFGSWTTGMWTVGVFGVWWFSGTHPELTEKLKLAFPDDASLVAILDPDNILLGIRIQEIVVFLIVAFILSQSVKRSNQLLINHAALERERANLARYFSPNVVEELSQNDEPLKQVRTQNVAVLFVDIVGFTKFAANKPPEQVIATLREFHGRMEREVFAHSGTLDKYLGDGLMATFGTPTMGEMDACNALRCARAMTKVVATWNAERTAKDDPPIRAGFGLHYGPVVLGDIGSSRLEFAVIGTTVNVASRLEALTRVLEVELIASDELIEQAANETRKQGECLIGLTRKPGQAIRGLDHEMTVWTI